MREILEPSRIPIRRRLSAFSAGNSSALMITQIPHGSFARANIPAGHIGRLHGSEGLNAVKGVEAAFHASQNSSSPFFARSESRLCTVEIDSH